jgi:hypothetical protein
MSYTAISKGYYFLLTALFISCTSSTSKKQVELFEKQCSRCHLAPSIEHLPKNIWRDNILPDMAARMGIKDSLYNPFKGLPFNEIEAIHKTGIYPIRPTISKENWSLLKAYILSQAPDSLLASSGNKNSNELSQFIPNPILLDSIKGTFITYLEYNKNQEELYVGDLKGNLSVYDPVNKNLVKIEQFNSAVVSYTNNDSISYTTAIGKLGPSELSSGRVFITNKKNTSAILQTFHRPVHTLVYDLNNNGKQELVISEFGNLTGKLTLLAKTDSTTYAKKTLLNQPGTIRVLAKDMNRDGKQDLIALTSQGDESITILYQKGNLKFRAKKVIRFSPIYGCSWFELIDYDNDGDEDIITVNGDNADNSYIHKPYHGLRIHINDGNNNFEEGYFYPLNGATRLVARDFDQDGDIDFGILSTFPDYDNNPEFSFVYLENTDSEKFTFKANTFENSKLSKWFLMDAGDIDHDGDEDIILSSFTYVLTPVPDELSALWNEKNVDLMILENNLKNKKQ